MVQLIDNRNTTDPRLNLALEEYALRNYDVEHNSYLLLYRNEPSVIIGKHQNVFEEVDYRLLEREQIPLVRRISGGGTVFHDLGNLNFSFITRYTSTRFNNYREFTAPIIGALQSLGVPAALNERNDIVIQGLKVSGNAQFTTRGRMLSHGTLLFNSNLELLRASLSSRAGGIESRSIKSVRSSVVNIADYISDPISFSEFQSVLQRHVVGDPPLMPTIDCSEHQWEQVRELARQRYDSWEWNYGRSPRFSVRREGALPGGDVAFALQIEEGVITEIEVGGTIPGEWSALLQQCLQGCRYRGPDLRAAIERWQVSLQLEGGEGTALFALLY